MTVTYFIRNFLATMTALAELWNIIATDHMKLTTVSTVRNANQNHIKTYIFSLMILIRSTHWNTNSVKLDKLDEYDISVICFILNDENEKNEDTWASWFWIVPEGPYFWKVHFVTRGKTLDIGSTLSSSLNANIMKY